MACVKEQRSIAPNVVWLTTYHGIFLYLRLLGAMFSNPFKMIHPGTWPSSGVQISVASHGYLGKRRHLLDRLHIIMIMMVKNEEHLILGRDAF